jgi:N-methylhydantoinase B
MSTDPVTAAVIASAVRANAMEMSEALRRSSHSPIIREMLDYSCAVFTPAGETVAQDELIPAFLGAMASTLPHVIAAADDDLHAGDAWMANDPYVGGTHTPDIQVFIPVLHDGRLIAWCGNIAHHNDVGGTNPGTEGYANGSIFEEGVRIPPLRFVERGEINRALLKLLENNVRDPDSLAGDLRAQLAAAKLGQRRMDELVARYGPDVLGAAMDEVLDQSERRIRAAIAARPDGCTTVEGWLDDDGLGSDPVLLKATVEIAGDSVRVNMTGSAPQMRGGLNLSATAAQAAIVYAVKAIFDPEAPQNGGVVRAVESVLPQGSLVNPDFPAAVSLRHLGALRLADTLIRGFGEMLPDVATAGTFVGFSSLAAECRHPRLGNVAVIQDDLGGGMGGHAHGDGLDAVDVYLGNVQILPAEICEQQFTVRIVSTELVPDSCGAGEFRGGLGIRRVYEFLQDTGDGVCYTEQALEAFAPQGIRGGLAGTAASLVVERADGSRHEFTKARLAMRTGDRLIITTGGGGGYGDPARRDRQAVLRDLREGKVSERAARDLYRMDPTTTTPVGAAR